VLTGSWSLNIKHSAVDDYTGFSATDTDAQKQPRWTYFGQSISGSILTPKSSYQLDFEGTNYIPTMTMLTHAPLGKLNHSNNPTYIQYTDRGKAAQPYSASYGYFERDDILISNVVSASFSGSSGSFEKTTYISKIGVYDDNKNLIAIAKLATPIKKTEARDLTFKLKLDL